MVGFDEMFTPYEPDTPIAPTLGYRVACLQHFCLRRIPEQVLADMVFCMLAPGHRYVGLLTVSADGLQSIGSEPFPSPALVGQAFSLLAGKYCIEQEHTLASPVGEVGVGTQAEASALQFPEDNLQGQWGLPQYAGKCYNCYHKGSLSSISVASVVIPQVRLSHHHFTVVPRFRGRIIARRHHC